MAAVIVRTAAENASGSFGCVWKRKDRTTFDASKADGRLMATPIAAKATTSLRTIRSTVPRHASAIRMPISRVRRETPYDSVP